MNLKLSEADRASLLALAETLRLDASATIRFLVGEKCRELGITAPTTAPAKKKRRAPGT